MKNSKAKTAMVIPLVLLSVLLYSIDSHAYPGGIAGRTLKTSTAGCGGCHNSSTAITGVITGPGTVTTGQTYTYTLTINMASGSGKYGVDIAVKNGTLGVGTNGSIIKLLSGELVQSAGITYSNPKIITFSYTAPATAGTDTLYATVDRGFSGAWAFAQNLGFTVQTVSGIINNSNPVSFGLEQNFPNPFNPSTQINYNIVNKGLVTLKIFDVLGKEVAVLVNENQEPGKYYAMFNGDNISGGVFYYKLESDGRTDTKKMILVK